MKLMRTIAKFKSKITVFDLVLLATIISLGIGFFFFFYRKGVYISVRVRVTDQDVLYAKNLPKNWYAQRFSVGDFELDALGRKIAEVTNVERFAISNETDVVFLDLKLKSTYDSRTKMYSARGKQIMYGAPMKFNLQQVTFQGIVTDFPGSKLTFDKQQRFITIRTLGRSYDPNSIRALQLGDSIYNSNGELLVEISKIEVRQAEKVSMTDSGDLLLRYDPLYQDLYLTLKLRISEFEGEMLMFDSSRVKVDQVVPLNFKKISIFPVIIDIIE